MLNYNLKLLPADTVESEYQKPKTLTSPKTPTNPTLEPSTTKTLKPKTRNPKA